MIWFILQQAFKQKGLIGNATTTHQQVPGFIHGISIGFEEAKELDHNVWRSTLHTWWCRNDDKGNQGLGGSRIDSQHNKFPRKASNALERLWTALWAVPKSRTKQSQALNSLFAPSSFSLSSGILFQVLYINPREGLLIYIYRDPTPM